MIVLAGAAEAQEPVALCSNWIASVDDTTQRIVLSWSPSPDTSTMGYHICTGVPCLDYDTVFGRLDTSYICIDHSPLERHTYRLHVFDSAYNVSSLTDPFGNMVLQAVVPECESTVNISWTPYVGMPGGVAEYSLLMRLEPHDSDYRQYHTTDSAGPTTFSYELPTWVTSVHVKVQARNASGSLVSQSNIVAVDRQTVDTASFVEISGISFDSLAGAVVLDFNIDTAYRSADHYTLWRSIDYSPWRILDTGFWLHYRDCEVNLYDSLCCYQLSVYDACGLNEKFSSTARRPPMSTCPTSSSAATTPMAVSFPLLQDWLAISTNSPSTTATACRSSTLPIPMRLGFRVRRRRNVPIPMSCVSVS